MVRTIIEDAKCPACDEIGLEYNAEHIDLPFLGESLETLIRCPGCGYRHTDFILTAINEPTRYRYTICEADDMMVRVVRASSGTIRIPELGVDIEPGMASDAFITNIEGIIVRVEGILDQLHRDAPDHEARQRIEAMQDTFAKMRDGKADPVTLVLEDPFGNSSILADRATCDVLSEEEAKKLKVGMLVYDENGPVTEP